MRLRPLLLVVPAVILTEGLAADTSNIYVDQRISGLCETYDSSTRACGGGDELAVSNAASGMALLSPGMTLVLREGRYSQINVTVSGTMLAPVAIRGMTGEEVVISGDKVALWIISQQDVRISNLVVKSVLGFGRIQDSSRVVVTGISFSDASASGTTGALKFVRSTENRVSESRFANGSDLLLLQDDSDRNIVENNVFGYAKHSDVSIRCSGYNVFRSNYFENPRQKIMEILDCEGISDAPVRLDDAHRNVIEHNWFAKTAPYGKANAYNAIQHGGQNTIVRRNIFSNNAGGGVNYQSYPDESLYVYGNRLYHNTFLDNRCFAVIGQRGAGNRFFDNRVVNNVFYRNVGCKGERRQVQLANSRQVIVEENSIVWDDPGFVGVADGNFAPSTDSELRDSGRFLTETVGAGSGRRLVLRDASWFYDGFGIATESGDRIRLEGTPESFVITSIDYDSGVVEIDSETSWSDGQKVHLEYFNNAPDNGAIEFGLDNSLLPEQP